MLNGSMRDYLCFSVGAQNQYQNLTRRRSVSFSDLLCEPFQFSADATGDRHWLHYYFILHYVFILLFYTALCILLHMNLKTVFMEHAKYFKDYVV